jgi:hypothetical protein
MAAAKAKAALETRRKILMIIALHAQGAAVLLTPPPGKLMATYSTA